MNQKDTIKITTHKERDLATKIIHRGEEYYVVTDFNPKTPRKAKTSIYHKGQITKTITHELSDTGEEFYRKIKKVHKRVVERIQKGYIFSATTKNLVNEIQRLISKNRYEEAEELVRIALEDRPDEPVLRAFWGYLVAKNKSNIEDGIVHCQEALKTAIRTHQPDINIALIYLNLGRAHLINNDRRSAIRAFKTGLGYDPDNRDLNNELVSLGVRKKPVISFLPRSHPINKYLGLLRERLFYRKKTGQS